MFSVRGINRGDGTTELFPITGYLAPTELGLAVCTYGISSSYRCGTLTELNLQLEVANP